MGGAVVPVRSPPVRAVRVRGLAENVVLCFVQDTVLSYCLSPVRCMVTGEIIDSKLLLGAEMLLVALWYTNRR